MNPNPKCKLTIIFNILKGCKTFFIKDSKSFIQGKGAPSVKSSFTVLELETTVVGNAHRRCFKLKHEEIGRSNITITGALHSIYLCTVYHADELKFEGQTRSVDKTKWNLMF